nr:porin [Vibrio hippocampi]
MSHVSANEYGQVGTLGDVAVQAYGKAAISVVTEDDNSGYTYDNESYIGFRASKQMFDDVNAMMQVESGYVGYEGASGTLGTRDTFVSLDGTWGQVRFGRMLTPMYEVVDWPYSNPGLGRVFDWGGDVGATYDRQSNMARYDSPDYGNLSFELSTGRGDKDVDGSYHYGGAGHYVSSAFTIHTAFEFNPKAKGTDIDGTAYLVGFELPLPAGFGLNAAYKFTQGPAQLAGWKYVEHDDDDNPISDAKEAEQHSISIIGQYFSGPWGFKVGYAKNFDSEVEGVKQNNEDEVLSAQIMYIHKGFVPYVRFGTHNAYNWSNEASGDKLFGRVGLEYTF